METIETSKIEMLAEASRLIADQVVIMRTKSSFEGQANSQCEIFGMKLMAAKLIGVTMDAVDEAVRARLAARS